MPIEMPRGLPFSVDTWTAAAGRKRHHFLTHAHSDHLAGITAGHASRPVYATALTVALARLRLPLLDDSLFVEIGVGETVVIDDPDGAFSVTTFDANHCPGAVMFLFGGEFGNVLHTGDCRLTPDCLHYLPLNYIMKREKETASCMDYLFLDCTFGRCSLEIPSKKSAIQQVISCIWKHPSAPVVYLACDLLGQEEILIEVSRTFGSKIFVNKVIEGFPRLYERASEKLAVAHANLQPEPLFIRPSAQWYAVNDQVELSQRKKPRLTEAERDEFGVWHVCYSMHSSREELEWALQLLRPKWVISTTPPCRAMELDYVKKYCFKTHITHDDPLWKLLNVNPGKSSSLRTSTVPEVPKDAASTSMVQKSAKVACNQDLKSSSLDNLELKVKSPSTCRPRPITLFGRARHGLDDILFEKGKSESMAENKAEILSIGKEIVKMQSSPLRGEDIIVAHGVPPSDDTLAEQTSSLPGVDRVSDSSVKRYEEANVKKEMSCVGSSNNFNASLRKLYRSRNIAVPRPLPSLVELLDVQKRIKITSGSRFNRLTYYCNSSEHL